MNKQNTNLYRVSTRFWWGKISKLQEKPYHFQHFLGVWDLKSISFFSSGFEIPYDFQQKFTTNNRLCQTDKQADHSLLTRGVKPATKTKP